MLHELERRLNFRTALINPLDILSYSHVNATTGEWTGQTRQLMDGEADMAFGALMNAFPGLQAILRS